MSKGTDSKEKIIERSIEVFNTKGYYGTSISEVMSQTGFKKGGIYRHFRSKEHLAEEAFKKAYSQLKSAYTGVYSEFDAPDLKLEKFYKHFKKFLFDPPVVGGCPILNSATEADDEHPFLRNMVSEAAKDWEETLIAIFEAGVEDGIFLRDIDTRREARWVISSIEGAVMLTKLHRDASYGIGTADFLLSRLEAIKK